MEIQKQKQILEHEKALLEKLKQDQVAKDLKEKNLIKKSAEILKELIDEVVEDEVDLSAKRTFDNLIQYPKEICEEICDEVIEDEVLFSNLALLNIISHSKYFSALENIWSRNVGLHKSTQAQI